MMGKALGDRPISDFAIYPKRSLDSLISKDRLKSRSTFHPPVLLNTMAGSAVSLNPIAKFAILYRCSDLYRTKLVRPIRVKKMINFFLVGTTTRPSVQGDLPTSARSAVVALAH